MGTNNSKKETKSQPPAKPKTMPYKRQFSSEAARKTQNTTYTEHIEDKKLAALTDAEKASLNTIKKYKPPPSPAVNDTILPTHDPDTAIKPDTIADTNPDDEQSDSMTDAQMLQIKKNTERAISPGSNVLYNDTNDDKKESPKKSEDKNTTHASNISVPSAEAFIKQTSNHDRLASSDMSTQLTDVIPNNGSEILQWGYCELTRKQLDEDQAAFLTWSHPSDGFVHAWAIFDGHGGYETALYSAQHFLKYVQKYHLTRKNMPLDKWKTLMAEIFVKFDQHIGKLNIRGGSTVVCVLLIGKTIICANAGDARAIMSIEEGKAQDLSFDHTPMDDYDRLAKIARNKDNYKRINKFFRINSKNETYADVQKLSASEMKKAPFISREQDKSRLLGTIGVARGFGDFALTVFGFRNIKLKPYLSAEPYVVIRELKESEICGTDIMCVACDGVFDVMTNQEVIDTLRKEMFYRKHKGDKEKKESVYLEEPDLKVGVSQIDRACGFLGLRSYAKGTMDDVTIFAVCLKQIFGFYEKNNKQ